jgi:hypothetical protein
LGLQTDRHRPAPASQSYPQHILASPFTNPASLKAKFDAHVKSPFYMDLGI